MSDCNSDSQGKTPVVAIVGPTAVGKTSVSIEVSKLFGCEVVSVDSMQVYKYMDIGTAKITTEEMEGVPHHLLDIVFPDQGYDAARFIDDASSAVAKIRSRGKMPLFVGGTGLYLKSFMEGLFEDIETKADVRELIQGRLDREGCSKLHEELQLCDYDSARRIHPNDSARLIRALEIFHSTGIPWSTHLKQQKTGGPEGQYDFLVIGLTCERQHLYKRINLRTEIMLEQGLEQEVENLLERGYSCDMKSMMSIGYRHMTNYLNGDWSKEKMTELLARDTRRYAKRQYTWFNKTKQLEWIDYRDTGQILRRVEEWLDLKKFRGEAAY